MRNDYEPILVQTPKEFGWIELYVISDLHYGNAQFDEKKWDKVKREILDAPNRFMVFAGDAMENAVPGSKSSMFDQRVPPHEQREWVVKQFSELRDRILAVVDGNHERNRSTRLVGAYPLYDACLIAGIEDVYRPHFAFVDIGVGTRKKDASQQTHYVVYVVHKAKDTKQYSSADFIDGIDILCAGHDHTSKDMPRGKLVYDAKLKQIRQASVEHLDAGSFLSWGGYAVDNAFRPTSDKLYKATLFGDEKRILTTGFYV